MPRPPRIFVNGAAYHVYCRTGRAEPIFRDRAEAREFVGLLAEVKQQDDLTVLAWCLMPSHYHLVLRTARVPLWRSMRLIQGRSSKAFNRRHDLVGAVWQGRYKAKLIVDGAYLRQAVVYTHLNPVAAGLVRDPAQYPWSGHRELAGRGTDALLDVDEVLLAFGSGRTEARAAYRQALRSVGAAPWLRSASLRLPWWRSPGDEEGEELRVRPGRPRLDALGASTAPARRPVEVERFVAEASTALEIDVDDLRAKRSDRTRTRAREALALLGVERFGVRVKDLAEAMRREPTVVSRWRGAGLGRWRADASFHDRVERLSERLESALGVTPSEAERAILGGGATFVD